MTNLAKLAMAAAAISCCGSAVAGYGLGSANTSSMLVPGFFFDYAPSGIVNSSGNVATWIDTGPSAFSLTASGAQRGTYVSSALNGFAGVQGIAANSTQMQSSGQFIWASKQATIYMVATVGSIGSETVLWETTIQAATNNGIGAYNIAGDTQLIQNNIFSQGQMAFPTSGYHVFVWQFDGTNNITSGSEYVDRSRMGWEPPTTYASNLPTSYLNVFGRQSSFLFPVNATIVHWVGYNGPHSEAQIQQNVNYLSTRYGINTATQSRNLFVEGDSISGGYVGLINKSWAHHVALDGAFPGTVLSSSAWPGKTLAVASANAAQTIANHPAGYVWDAIIFEGTNDAGSSGSITPATMYGYVTSYTAALFSAGARHVGWVTMLPRNGSFSGGQTTGGFETLREGSGGYNPLMRSGAAGCCAKAVTLIDLAGDATMGQPGDENNATYYNGDGVHPNDTGETYIYTNYIAPTLTTWN